MSDSRTLATGETEQKLGSIGPYRLIRVLGSGGMGVVYEAEQSEPVRRRVAVKVIRAHFEQPETLARFQIERQAMALMDHPNIARVLDAGQTDEGRPFVVMELVRGKSISEFCDSEELTLDERLELFCDLCDAVQHAHLKGVIHRDLKPSNVLVADQEGRVTLKVIDFGIAKAIDNPITDSGLVTQAGIVVGTPAYMSPEQASGNPVDVDTRTDVYSLGVILYRLVTGCLPIDPRELGVNDYVRQLADKDLTPLAPSARFMALGQGAEAIARKYGTNVQRMRRRLKGDLSWIVMKAMAVHRRQRYATPSELRADILRFVANDAVEARPPSVGYRFGRFVRRHRVGVAVTGLVAVSLLVGFGSALYGLVKAQRAEHSARVEANATREVASFLVDLLSQANPKRSGGVELSIRELVERGAQRVQIDLVNQPLVQARLLEAMGSVFTALAAFDRADEMLDGASEIRSSIQAENHPDQVGLLQLRANLLRAKGEYAAGAELLEQALIMPIEDDQMARVHGDLLNDLGVILDRWGKSAEAEATLSRALPLRVDFYGKQSNEVAQTLNNLGSVAWSLGRREDAEGYFRESLVVKESLLPDSSPSLATTLSNLATVNRALKNNEQSEILYGRAMGILSAAYGPTHPGVGDILINLGGLLEEQGRVDEALDSYQEALQIAQSNLGDVHPDVGIVLHNLGNLYRDQANYVEAERHYVRSQEIFKATLDSAHIYLGYAFRDFAILKLAQEELLQADAYSQDAMAVFEQAQAGGGADLIDTLKLRAEILRQLGRGDSAKEVVTRAASLEEG